MDSSVDVRDVLSVQEALLGMQQAVRSGAIPEARAIGARAVVPLSLGPPDLQLGPAISQGAESVVLRGSLRGQDVAIKRVRLSTSSDLDRYRSELLTLARLDHPHIVKLLGAKALPPDYMLVLPLESTNMREQLYDKAWRPGWQRVLLLGRQLADACAYMHEARVVHRDIKPANILLSPDCDHAYLTDFGISASLDELRGLAEHSAEGLKTHGRPTGGFHKRLLVGTLEYMAPEVLLKQPQSPASDAYALAVVINELATAIFPFSDCTKDNPEIHTVLEMGYGRQELAAAVAAEGLRPQLPRSFPPGYAQLMEACWGRDPQQRPSMAQVAAALASIAEGVDAWEAEEQQLQQAAASAVAAAGSGDVRAGDAAQQPQDHQQQPEDGEAMVVDGAPSAGPAAAGGGQCRWVEPLLGDYQPVVTAGAFEAIGPRDSMEDRHVVLQGLCGRDDMHALAVFDGHRGHQVAAFAARHLPSMLSEACCSSSSAEEALKATFLRLDAAYRRVWESDRAARLSKGQTDERYPGCTAVVVLVAGSKLYAANAGDSRAVLCRGESGLPLTRDHTAALEDERQRITACGGRVTLQHGSWRIGSSGLQVSRSLGDFDEKGRGVTAEPEVTSFDLSNDDHFVIIATDGLWDVVGNDEAVGLVLDTVKQAEMCGKRLVLEALSRGSTDNVTALVAFLRPVASLERVFKAGRQQARAITATAYGSRAPVRKPLAASADEVRDTY